MHTALPVRPRRWSLTAILGMVATWAIGAGAQVPQTPRSTLPLTPQRERGASITPAYEGWFQNADGSFSMLIGYYNRNAKETLDIPIGPNNRIEPGDGDQGQPTHFEVGRQWGVFVIKVPKDFGTKVMTWTIVANGETQSIPFTLNKGYPISPYKELGMGNQPPVLTFSEGGAKVTGPPTAVAADFTAAVDTPLPISVWVEDPEGAGRRRESVGTRLHPFGRDHFAPQIPRSRHGDIRQSAHPCHQAGREGQHCRELRGGGRLSHARPGQRRVRGGGRRFSVLLDQYLRESGRPTVEYS